MKDFQRKWQIQRIMLWVGIGLIVGLVLFQGNRPTPSIAQGDSHSTPGIRAFDRLSEQEGWIWLGERLYRTSDSGHSWSEITPPLSAGLRLTAVQFINPQSGWAVLVGNSLEEENFLFLSRTVNGGKDWTTVPIPLTEADRWLPFAQAYLTVWDAEVLWVVQKIASSANFSLGLLYRSSDGGSTWQRFELPVAEPIRAASPTELWLYGGPSGKELYRSNDGGQTWLKVSQDVLSSSLPHEEGAEELGRVSPRVDWRLEQQGSCEPLDNQPSTALHQAMRCSRVERLWSTTDGGRTWQVVTLPDGQVSQTTEEKIDTEISLISPSSHPLGEAQPEMPLVAWLQGHGFDKCEVPSLDQLSVWRAHSPYRAVNLYIGGIHRACPNTALNAEFIAQLRRQGWGLIPTWVGLQARCTNYRYRMSKYPPKAYQEGRTEAEQAIQVAQGLGLTNAAGQGSVIYYDLEHYDIRNEECNQAAQAFINGWVERMNELGMIGGVYSTGRPLSQFADLPNPPPVIWAAHWIFPAYASEATVWNVLGLPNELWNNRQRLRQYAGGHNETWGDVTLNIDSNVMDGIVSFHLYIPQGLDYQYYFPLITK